MAVKREKPPPTDPTTERPPTRAGARESASFRIGSEDNRASLWTQEAQGAQEKQDTQEIQEPHGVFSSPREKDGSCVSCVSCVNQEGEDSTLREFLKRAAGRSTKELLKHEGSARPEEYRGPAWMFARCLKGRKEFAGFDAEQATARVDAELEAMFPESPMPWLDLGLQDFDSRNQAVDPRTDFLSAWEAVTTPFRPGSFVQEAAQLARESPLDLGPRFSHPADVSFRRLVSLCYWLGQHSEGEFFLSCRDAGDAVGISPTMANQLLRRAEKAGFIKAARAYSDKDRARRDAKTWRFEPASLIEAHLV